MYSVVQTMNIIVLNKKYVTESFQ